MAAANSGLVIENLYSSRGRFYRDKIAYFLNMLEEHDVLIKANEKIAKALEPYVPSKSGALARSWIAHPNVITWGEKPTPGFTSPHEYARYQYGGQVYGVNLPIWEYQPETKTSRIIGWYTPKSSVPKQPNGNELGVPGNWMGWSFGYTTPGTMHHWVNAYKGDVKAKTNLEITMFLKRECRRRGFDV
jgi:hypothetical protein